LNNVTNAADTGNDGSAEARRDNGLGKEGSFGKENVFNTMRPSFGVISIHIATVDQPRP